MATITGLTADRMLEIEASSVVDGDVVAGDLILQKHDGSEINAGSVVGPTGPQGPAGMAIVAMPGEIRIWPSSTLPDETAYGKWAWANGDVFDEVDYPEAAANIDSAWKTAHGAANPGTGKFRVPDMRGFVPAGMDAMPVGSPRANRVARPEGILQARSVGEEKHVMVTAEMPKHSHVFAGTPLGPHGHAGSSFAGNAMPAHAHGIDAEAKQVFPTTGAAIAVTNILHGDGSGATAGYAFYGNVNAVSAGVPSGSVAVAGASAGTPAGANSNTGGGGADPVGQGQSHENMQPTVFVPYIVKLDD